MSACVPILFTVSDHSQQETWGHAIPPQMEINCLLSHLAMHKATRPKAIRPSYSITPLAPPSYRGLNETFCTLFLGSKASPVFQSSSPVQWSSPLNRDCLFLVQFSAQKLCTVTLYNYKVLDYCTLHVFRILAKRFILFLFSPLGCARSS